MTKAERAELQEIVDLFFRDSEEGDGQFYIEGLTKLCRIAGMKWPAGEMLMRDDLPTIAVEDIAVDASEREGDDR